MKSTKFVSKNEILCSNVFDCRYFSLYTSGSLDFGKTGDGRWKISSIAIPCPVVGNIRFKFQGSNPWYLKLQVANAK